MKALHILKYLYNGAEIGMPSLNKIDEAIKELEELQNRNCDNCLHLRITQFRDYEKATCTNEKCNEMFDCDVGNDFCCNKWEAKE